VKLVFNILKHIRKCVWLTDEEISNVIKTLDQLRDSEQLKESKKRTIKKERITMAKANVGDLILVTNAMFPGGKYSNGDIFEVIEVNEDNVRTSKGALFNEEFEIVSQNLLGVIANLARRVSSLEDQLRMTQGNVETLAQESANLSAKLNETSELTEMALSDIVFLDERTMAHNISVNLRIDREADVSSIAEALTKFTKGGDAE
jgi:hypothetical protein